MAEASTDQLELRTVAVLAPVCQFLQISFLQGYIRPHDPHVWLIVAVSVATFLAGFSAYCVCKRGQNLTARTSEFLDCVFIAQVVVCGLALCVFWLGTGLTGRI